MSAQGVTDPPTPSDAELITAVRGGDTHAYGTLFERHREAALRLARQIAGASDADDLVSDAFTKVFTVLKRGKGPDVAFRAYLLTSVRRLHVDRIRAAKKVTPTDEMEEFDPGVPFADPAVANFENEAASRAFASLPERWQLVLWHVEVEGQRPADVAPLLGMSPNSVSALAYRAREGLRQAYLQMHLADTGGEECRWVTERLGARVRGGLSRRDTAKVDAHLDECRRCAAVYLELGEVNSNLSGIIAPLLLGGAAAGYLASSGTTAATGLGLLFFKAHHLIKSNAGVAAGTAAASVVAVAAAAAVIATQGSGGDTSTADAPAASSPVVTSAAPSSSHPPSSPPSSPPAKKQQPQQNHQAPAVLAPDSPPATTQPATTQPATTQPAAGSQDPDVSFSMNATSGPAPLKVSVDASGSRDPQGDALTYSFDFGDHQGSGGRGVLTIAPQNFVSGASSTASHIYRTPGTYTLKVGVTDSSGHTSTKARTITVDAPKQQPPPSVNHKPDAKLSLTTRIGSVPLDVVADASKSSDPDGDKLRYTYRWGDGSTTRARHHSTRGHTYKDSGTYTVTVTVRDDARKSDTAVGKVTVKPVAPTAVLSVTPQKGTAPLEIEYDARDSQGDDLKYTIDFDDDHTTTDPRGEHLYAEPGTYEVELTVEDSAGTTATDTRTVTVNEPAPTFDIGLHAAPRVPLSEQVTVTGNEALPSDSTVTVVITYEDGFGWLALTAESDDWECLPEGPTREPITCTAAGDVASPITVTWTPKPGNGNTPGSQVLPEATATVTADPNTDPDLSNNTCTWGLFGPLETCDNEVGDE